jgi:hypothetical protein
VAKVIATIGGVALRPGISRNRRLYTRPMIAKAVQDAQERIRGGAKPMVMLTHHGAEDDSRQIVAHLTGVALDEDGNARYTAAIADTAAGRDIAALVDDSDGRDPHLKGVSIRGFWTGTVRKVKGQDGEPVETGNGLDWDGLDFTRAPGVDGAGNDTFAWADRSGRSETTERVPICESVEEARVTISEDTLAEETEPAPLVVPESLAEALAAVHATPHILENGICMTCAAVAEAGTPMSKRTSGTHGVGGPYADPGYQGDKKQRYQLDNKAHAKAAWAFISKQGNAAKYTAQQLKRIKAKIKAALRRFGVAISAESAGWTVDAPVLVTEALAEYYGDPSCAGSWSVNASNGPVSICLSSYSMAPEDLDVILRAGADAACKALAALDPDMDGDIDVPGASRADTDHDGGENAAAEDPVGEADPDPADPAATETGTEDPAMAAETTNPAEQAPDVQTQIAEGIAAGLAQAEEARQARKAAKRAREAAAAQQQTTETAATAQGVPAPAGASVSETEDQRRARLAAIVEAQFAEAAQREGLTAAKTDEDLVREMIEERLVPLRQAQAERGGVQRKGVVTEVARQGMAVLEGIGDGGPGTQKILQEASNDALARAAAAGYPSPAARH